MMQKKGLSPLIATVLMIAVAVSLGTLIMSLGAKVGVEGGNQSFKCADLSFGVHKYSSGELDICFDGSKLRFTLVAYRGRVANVKLVAYSTGSKVFTADRILEKGLKPGEPQKLSVGYDRGIYGELKEIQLYPYTSNDEAGFCPDAQITVAEIPFCS